MLVDIIFFLIIEFYSFLHWLTRGRTIDDKKNIMDDMKSLSDKDKEILLAVRRKIEEVVGEFSWENANK